jgi:hypothetical protein
MTDEKKKIRELTRRQEAALIALMEGDSLGLAATKARISARSLSRWLHEDDLFIKTYRSLRAAAVEAGVARIQGLMNAAIDCLERGLASGNKPSEARCAVSIINQSISGVDEWDFDNRIRAVEAKFEKGK